MTETTIHLYTPVEGWVVEPYDDPEAKTTLLPGDWEVEDVELEDRSVGILGSTYLVFPNGEQTFLFAVDADELREAAGWCVTCSRPLSEAERERQGPSRYRGMCDRCAKWEAEMEKEEDHEMEKEEDQEPGREY